VFVSRVAGWLRQLSSSRPSVVLPAIPVDAILRAIEMRSTAGVRRCRFSRRKYAIAD